MKIFDAQGIEKSGAGPPGLPGAPGANGTPGAAGPGQPPGASWLNPGGIVTIPTNDVLRLINGPATIKEVVIVTQGGPGSCVIDCWKANLSSHFPPVVADTIFTTKPSISAGTVYQDSTLTGVTTSLAQDDMLLFRIVSSSVFTNVQIQLRLQ